uniref:Disease resistance N-terminal domain-containing protein n=1 Tax=Oryza rufipogon TaxID=4529 RepID=A0A0E0R8M7_ORYRU
MAGLLASLAIRKALEKLSSYLAASLSASSSSTSGRARHDKDLEDLRMLERTMRRIHATVHDAEQHWNIREESTKLRLKELKDLAYHAEDVVDAYEMNRQKTSSVVFENSIVGREKDKNNVVEKLLSKRVIVKVTTLDDMRGTRSTCDRDGRPNLE